MKRLGYLLISTLLVVTPLIVGHARGASTSKPATELPSAITIATFKVGSAIHTKGTAICKVVSKYTPMALTVEPYDGTAVYLPLVQKGKIDFGYPPSHELLWAYRGQVVYEKLTKGKGYPDLRAACVTTGFAVGLVAAGDTGIKTPDDIRGKRVALVSKVHYGAYASTIACLANLNISEDEIIKVPVPSFPASVRAVIEGRADLACPSLGSAVLEQLKAARGARYISLDNSPEALERLYKIYPVPVKLFKAGSGTGIVEDTWLPTIRFVVICAKTTRADVVTSILGAMWDHMDDLQATHPLMRDMTTNVMCTKDANAPYHTAAIKFFREKGLWTAEMEEFQKDMLARR